MIGDHESTPPDTRELKRTDSAIVVRSALIAQLYSQVRVGMLAAIVAGVALAALLWSVVPPQRVTAWLVVFLAIQIPRHVLLRRFHRIAPQGAEAIPWETLFLLGSGSTSLLFGMTAWVIFPSDSFLHQCVLGCFLGGFAASTVVAQAPVTKCYVTSVLLTILPPLGRFLYQGGESGVVLALVGLAFAAALLGTGGALHRMIVKSIRLGFEKDLLLEEISKSREDLERAVVERTAQLSARNQELAIEFEQRREAEEALRRFEDLYRSVIDNIEDVFYRSDTQGRLLMGSPSGARLFGYDSVEEMIGLPLDSFWVDPQDRDRLIAQIQRSGSVKDFEGILKRKDGSTFVASFMTHLYLDESGTIQGTQGIIRDVTARKEAERKVMLSEERLRLAWETSPDALSISRTDDGTYVDINEGYTVLTGYDRDEVLGKSALELPFWADPLDRQPFVDHLKQHGSIRNFETRLRHKDGGKRSILISAGLMMLSGEPHLLAVTKDIEDLKRAESALRESEQKYRLLAENSSDVIWSTDLNLRIKYISPSVERMFGWTASEWLALNPSDYLTPPALENVSKVLREELAVQRTRGTDPNRVRTLELEQFRKDGASFWTEVTARFLYDGEGDWVGIIGATRDITERRKSQEELQRLSAAIQQAGEAIVITEPDGTILYANPAFENTTGYPLDQVMGKTAAILKSGKHNKDFYADMWFTLKRGEVWRGRFTNKKRDGALYEEAATISPIKDESGHVSYYVMVGRDISSEVMLQRQLNQAQKMEAIGTLAGGIAHDFNNLLQAILGYSDILLMKKSPGDPDRKKLEVIQHAARDGADLVSRILTISRKAESLKRPIDLNEEILKAQKLLQRTVPRMIEIKPVLAENLQIIDGDSAQMEQILLNLAINAQHAMPEGGQVLIETSNVSLNDEYLRNHLGAKPGHYVLLAVSDTGVGMEPEVLDRIFEPFFTTKTDGEGTGLGLSMVHGIVSQHGGYIKCYSERGVGTTFKIYFPVSVGEAIPELAWTREMPAFGTETILLVDDDDRVREMAVQMIETGGYKVLTARSGEEALEVYLDQTEEISLVILDLIMPGMGGNRCLEELLRSDPEVKVIVASGYSSNGLTQDEKGRGAFGFINKPYDAKHILTAIRKVLDGGRL